MWIIILGIACKMLKKSFDSYLWQWLHCSILRITPVSESFTRLRNVHLQIIVKGKAFFLLTKKRDLKFFAQVDNTGRYPRPGWCRQLCWKSLGSGLLHSPTCFALSLPSISLPSSQMDSCPEIKRGFLINIWSFGIHNFETIEQLRHLKPMSH